MPNTNVASYEVTELWKTPVPAGPFTLDLVSPTEIDAEAQSEVPDRPMQVVGGVCLGELPRVVRYRETSIGCSVGEVVIGAADVLVPGRGVRTIYGTRRLRVSYAEPFDVSGEELYVGACFHIGAATKKPSRLNSGQTLRVGDELASPNGQGRLVLQTDGNLVLYTKAGYALWATGNRGSRAVMQKDGNFVLYDARGGVAWASGTEGHPGAYVTLQNDGNLVVYQGNTALWSSQTNGWKKTPTGGFWSGVTSAASAAVHPFEHAASWAGHSVNDAANLVDKIPVVGPAFHKVLDATVSLGTPFALISKVASGANISDAVIGDLKDKLAAAKDVAPYAQALVSAVPGVGTGVAAALAAASALAQGKSITDTLVAAVRGAVPGGALGQMAFDTATKIASGANVLASTLEAARAQLPAEAQKAFDIALAVAHGRKIQDAVLDAVKSMGPDALHALGAAGLDAIAKSPALQSVERAVSDAAKPGFNLASGILAHTGITPEILVHAREKLSPELRQGFDAAVAAHARIFPSVSAAVKRVSQPDLAAAVMNSARSLVNSAAGSALHGISVRIPGATPSALAAYSSASQVLDSIKRAEATFNVADSLKARAAREKRPLTAAEQDIVKKGAAAKKVHDDAVRAIGAIRAAAEKGDPKEQKRLAVLQAVKKSKEMGAGRHGHFISDTGQIILRGVWAPA